MERSKEGGTVGQRLVRTARRAVALLIVVALATPVAWAQDEPLVDLNTASAAELTALPGIGPAKAEAIVEYRETAPFKSADELVQVKGIGAKLYEQLKGKVTVAAAPVKAGGGDAARSGAGDGSAASGRTAAASAAR